MTTNLQAAARVASHPGGPVLTTMRFDAALRFSAVCPDTLDLFRVSSADALLGRTPWDLHPQLETAPLTAVMRDVLATRRGRVVLVPSALRGVPVWARVSPCPDGGVRVAVRFQSGRRRRRRALSASTGALLWSVAADALRLM